ncbi:3-oxoacyl-ACP reductase family protein [Actinoalloteichus hymeniacidonis]|uniref:3-oxoacyl-(Acyl-carrier-protein) reductase n=1 Tax=Actinoalloteichus hymeniacidonis TaxID=340345 RepID=A0AAC9HMH1_9PSEU|nr:3-oxoacyl-ACP reductase family protein [Actinoalloteichus hymeniacidonis]AOS61960.1 3-oxoacyl-(acyl-carrier-protein) reductase [Actinoalloteichus hymeniacidonis]MBB5910018.1 3-oxoacyl-[acyl-carrier protein] reductase [Actinoalloteichus hymeniacidonis]
MLFPEGSVALVTGGSRGIGRAAALDLAREGAHVLVNYARSESDAKEAVAEIEEAGGKATAICADVTDEAAVREMFQTVRSEYGRLDVLVTSAGITRDRHLVAMSLAQFREPMDVNVTGTFLVCREGLRIMQHQRSGAIVTLSSSSGLDGGFPGQTNYVASKGAIISFTKALAYEAAPHGVRANVVAPGFVATDMTRALSGPIRKQYESRIRLGRMGRPDEIARLVSFLASENASYVTGAVLVANGGGLG